MTTWREDAECVGVDTDLFYEGHTKEARAICNRCPVRDACLEEALVNNIQFGMWGGKTPEERKRLVEMLTDDSL